MSKLKELRQSTRWIGSGKKGKKTSVEDTLNADDFNIKPEKFEKLVVPGQSKSIKEMMDRYEKGRPNPTD